MLPNMFKELKANRSLRVHCDTPTFKLINGVHVKTIKHFVFSVISIMAGLIVEILYKLFSI